jgi:hypothetical protein
MRVESSSAVTLAPDVVLQQIGDEAVLLKLTEETVFVLNGTAAAVAALIGQGLPERAIVEELASRYAALADVVAGDVRALIDVLVRRGLVQAEENGASAC